MKKIFKHFGILLGVALLGTLSGCTPEESMGSADIGLGIKVFAPTKVVAGQPMTINGSDFSKVSEIVFPNGVTVTDFELVSNEMIRVNAPAGIAADGGKIIVRGSEGEAESPLPLTLGNTVVSGYSRQPGETVTGGEQITIYGTDLEFINRLEILDEEGNPLFVEDEDFYRKGTSSVVITFPRKIFEGTYIAYLHTFDGKRIPLPEFSYVPAADDEGGHWEIVEEIIWEGTGEEPVVNWSGTFRYANEQNSTGEEIYAMPMDVWARLKTETFYVTVKGENPQIRVVTGWWNNQWPDSNDIFPGNELLKDNGDGTFTLAVTLKGHPLADAIDTEHLLFTGSGFIVTKIAFQKEEWIDGGGHMEIVKTPIWTGTGEEPDLNWGGTFRFANEQNSTGEEIYAMPMDMWARLKTETFYVTIKGANPQIRVVTGWWNNQWPDSNDIFPGNELLTDNGDGTFTLAVTLAGHPLADAMDTEHLLFTGSGYIVTELYFQEEIWVDGGGGPKEVPVWEGTGEEPDLNWGGTFRFANEQNSTGEEIYAMPMDMWARLKTETFYVTIKGANPQIRVVTGWWNNQWPDSNDIFPGNELLTDNGDGTFTLAVTLAGHPLADAMDTEHLLFTGSGYIVTKLYFLE
ncbi:MAG: hypothetical protein IJL91_15595 [Bacteroidales bacterium]|nr:hypothetical protein [Bacteroidales bacterium]